VSAAALGLATALALLPAGCRRGDTPGEGEEESGPGDRVQLYFPGTDDRLHAEAATLPASAVGPAERLRALAQLWAAGPSREDLQHPLPQVEAIRVDLAGGGRLYVDLQPREGALPPQVGSTEEETLLYSLVDTFALNVPEVRDVVLLWDGEQQPALGGHLDTSAPLTPRTDLLAAANDTAPDP